MIEVEREATLETLPPLEENMPEHLRAEARMRAPREPMRHLKEL
jgi:hypothetical protein